MTFIVETGTTVEVRLTNKGRELLTKGEHFNLAKFCFGDSEIDYTSDEISGSPMSYPNISNQFIKTKLYYRGNVPTGDPEIVINNYVQNIPRNSTLTLNVYTTWHPVQNYYEQYNISTVGEIDYRYVSIQKLTNNHFNINTYDLTGSTQIKVLGLMSNEYTVLDFNIV
jgi:hypothetical protein